MLDFYHSFASCNHRLLKYKAKMSLFPVHFNQNSKFEVLKTCSFVFASNYIFCLMLHLICECKSVASTNKMMFPEVWWQSRPPVPVRRGRPWPAAAAAGGTTTGWSSSSTGWAAPGRSGPSRGTLDRSKLCRIEPCIAANCQVLGEGGAQGDQAGAAHRAQAARHPLLRPGHDLLVSSHQSCHGYKYCHVS